MFLAVQTFECALNREPLMHRLYQNMRRSYDLITSPYVFLAWCTGHAEEIIGQPNLPVKWKSSLYGPEGCYFLLCPRRELRTLKPSARVQWSESTL